MAATVILKPSDFDDGWTVQQNGISINAVHKDFMVAKKIDLDIYLYENSESAFYDFQALKNDANNTLVNLGISGREVDSVKNYDMFVWNKSPKLAS